MKVHSLGHVVLKVRDQQRAEDFYNGLLGIPIAARYAPLSMTFFTLGNHHDFAVLAMGGDAEDPLIAAAADCKLWNSTVTIVPSRATMAAYIASELNAQARGVSLRS